MAIFICAGLFYFYDNMDNPTLRVAQAVLESDRFAGQNAVVLLYKTGLPSHVNDKLVKNPPLGTIIVLADDSDFTGTKVAELANKYPGHKLIALRLQVAMNSASAVVTYSYLGGTPQYLTVNYDSKSDSWKI
jgi:hypothetical protein